MSWLKSSAEKVMSRCSRGPSATGWATVRVGLPGRVMVALRTPRTGSAVSLRTLECTVSRAVPASGSESSVLTVDGPMSTGPNARRVTGLKMPALRSGTKETPPAGFLPGPRYPR